MLQYKLQVNDEARAALVELALESKGNRRRRRIMRPVCFVLAAAYLLLGVSYVRDAETATGVILLAFAAVLAALALWARRLQGWMLRLMQRRADKRLNSGERSYVFAEDGVEILSEIGKGKSFPNAFECWGQTGHYYYLKRVDNQYILADERDLTPEQAGELRRIWQGYFHKD